MSPSLTAGLLHRRGNPGIKGRLLAKSVEAYVLALETINRLTITYRIETFCTLTCNAWELLLKARILDQTHDRNAIYYRTARHGLRRSLSLTDCIAREFPDEKSSVRRNLERVQELRDAAIHLFISDVPRDVLGLLQAAVLNYHRCLTDWFGVSLAERVPVGMMTVVFDVSPETLDLTNAMMRRRLGKDASDYLLGLTKALRDEHAELNHSPSFSVEIRYSLAIQKRPDGASAIAISDPAGAPTSIVTMPRDPGDLYPYRQTELLDVLNSELQPSSPITSGDVQAVVATEKVKRRSEWFYRGRVPGSPGQYSRAFAEWFMDLYRSDPSFLLKARGDYRALLRSRAATDSPDAQG